MARDTKQVDNTAISAKVSEKGAISVYMVINGRRSRFPVTLYADQWLAILDRKDALVKFIRANSDKLADQPSEKSTAVTGATAL